MKIYHVDAFTEKLFKGNPAAVCILSGWPDEKTMQNIALENNLSETAFAVKKNDHFEIRWFSPGCEVDLCGHATLAASHIIFNHMNYEKNEILFYSKSGELRVRKEDDLYVLNFPSDNFQEVEISEDLINAIGKKPQKAYRGKFDYMLVYDNQSDIENMNPDYHALAKVKTRGIIVTAKGDKVDFVSRFFCPPELGITEDPVTGSAHTTLTPYWSEILNKTTMTAHQLSKRRGVLKVRHLNERVEIAGNAVTYMIGEIFI